jgi:hypothetical protein
MPATRPVLLDVLALCAALKGAEPGDVRVVEASFLPLHAALAARAMDEKAWSLLDRDLPPADRSWSWDRCERLRQGLITYLARNGGTLERVLAQAPPDAADMIRRTAEALPEGRELLARAPAPQR